jgi:hypothetical protein
VRCESSAFDSPISRAEWATVCELERTCRTMSPRLVLICTSIFITRPKCPPISALTLVVRSPWEMRSIEAIRMRQPMSAWT